MRTISSWLGLLALSSSLLVAAPAAAGEATDLVKTKQSSALELIKKEPKPSKERDARLTSLLLSLFHFETMARMTLPEDEWNKHSDAEKKEFVGLLTRLTQRSLEKNLLRMVSYSVEYLAEDEKAGFFIVKTRASKQGSDAVEIDYTLRKIDGKMSAVDMAPEGMSTVKSYRSQFARIIAKEGWSGLIARMKKRLDRGED